MKALLDNTYEVEVLDWDEDRTSGRIATIRIHGRELLVSPKRLCLLDPYTWRPASDLFEA